MVDTFRLTHTWLQMSHSAAPLLSVSAKGAAVTTPCCPEAWRYVQTVKICHGKPESDQLTPSERLSAPVERTHARRFDTPERRTDEDGKGGFSQREGELDITAMMTRGIKPGRALLGPPTTTHDSLPVYVDLLLWQRVKLQVGDSSIDWRSKSWFCHSDKKMISQGEVSQLPPEY